MNDASSENYELLDFGEGRKLERFGDFVLDRPSPAAEGVAKASPNLWREATARYERKHGDEGVWTPRGSLPSSWTATFSLLTKNSRDPTGRRGALGGTPATQWVAATPDVHLLIRLQLQASPFGHVGVFPEQLENWKWIVRQIVRAQTTFARPLRVLNLFAYTGGSTLAAAAAGAEVVHIDAARNIVDRARRNAELSALADRPIRWIAEGAMKFCQRERKRGSCYDAVILDPPSYGHGPKGEPWKIGEHLLPLLECCGALTADRPAFVLLTCHSPEIGPAELAAYLSDGIFGNCGQPPKSGELFLQTAKGRRLPSGIVARWPA